MKVLHVTGATRDRKIYVPVKGAVTQSLVFTPAYVDSAQDAVVGGKARDGDLFYVGDVNGEQESNKIILALCALNGD